VTEGDRLQPVDTDVDVVVAFVVASRQIKLLAAWRAHADKNRVKIFLQQRTHARNGRVVTNVDAHVQDDLGLFVEHSSGQAEFGNVRAHETAGYAVLLEDHDFVTERHEVVGDGERRGPRPDASNALAVLFAGNDGQSVSDVVSQVRGDALEATDRDGAAVDAVAPTGRFARSVTGPAQDSGKDVGLTIEHVRVSEFALGNHAQVPGNIGVRGAGPLTIDDLVVVTRVLVVCTLHAASSFMGPHDA
jgi:hypothetical protein